MLSDKEKMQIREVVDKVVVARLNEFAEIQLTLISDMMISMTEKYVESLMKLCRVVGLPEEASKKEAERMAELMLKGFKK